MTDQKTRHRIIALWCHPRSMSTALERIMRERGEFTCFHEPFMYDYYIHRRVREMPHFEPEAGRPVSYEEVRGELLRSADTGPVFFKDMSYYVVPAMFDDPEFARAITHTFLIRDPSAAILSYHKLDPELTNEEVGLEAQWRHFEWLRDALGVAPVVLKAEDVRRDPQAAMAAFWSALDLDFAENAFDWNRDKPPEDWGQVSGWHGKASESTSIQPLSEDEARAKQAEFEAVAEAYPGLRDMLEHHRPFYDRLKAQAVLT